MKRLPLILLLLAGCGQSGPLYIPGDPSTMAEPEENTQPEQSETEEEDQASKPE